MDDVQLGQFEAELGRVGLPGVPAALRGALAARMERPAVTVADRILLGVTGAGALAALVIVSLTVWQLSVPATPEVPVVRHNLAAEYAALLASQ